MEVLRVMFANSVKVGNNEMLFFKNDDYSIEKDGPEFKLTHRATGMHSHSSIYNAKFWVQADEPKTPKPHKGQ